jgi:hypothetical protein
MAPLAASMDSAYRPWLFVIQSGRGTSLRELNSVHWHQNSNGPAKQVAADV